MPSKLKQTFRDRIKDHFKRRSPGAIRSLVREPTAGGIIFRLSPDQKKLDILLAQDSKGRWTIPKGHIEPGETARDAALREIREETGLKNLELLGWIGKTDFEYRRGDKLVLMTLQVYLVRPTEYSPRLVREKWMNQIGWFSFAKALDLIEYEDLSRLLLLAKKKIREGNL